MDKTTVHTEIIRGIPLLIPNKTINGDGFYISYNNYDVSIYGCDTTALVVGRAQHFYILNGDHRREYSALINTGLDSCLEYFNKNTGSINKYSDKYIV